MYKILIVEDDMVIVNQVAKRLEKWGYCVQLTTDFMTVVEQFVKFEPQLVLMLL